MARRLPAIFLLSCFVALGTGLLNNLHLRAHILEHAKARALAPTDPGDSDQSEDGCDLCQLLHLAVLAVGWAPLLVCLGLFVSFLTLLAPAMAPQRVTMRIACRGPPALL